MIATRPATRGETLKDHPYPTVSQEETRIFESEQKLKLILRKEENLVATRQALVKLPETEETNRQWSELKVQIVTVQDQKSRAEERLKDLKKKLPRTQDEAEKNEADLIATRTEVEELKTELTKINKRLTKSLTEPMAMLKKRTEALSNLEKAIGKISTLSP